MKPKIIIAVILFILFIIIVVQNTQVITFNLLFWQLSMSQILVVLLTTIIGFVLGYIVATLRGKESRHS